jgi:hypothetical protein
MFNDRAKKYKDNDYPQNPLGPDGRELSLGRVVALDVVTLVAPDADAGESIRPPGQKFAAGALVVDAPCGMMAVDLAVTTSQQCRITRAGDSVIIEPTGAIGEVTSTRFVSRAALAAPVPDDAGRERLAHALADVLMAEVAS